MAAAGHKSRAKTTSKTSHELSAGNQVGSSSKLAKPSQPPPLPSDAVALARLVANGTDVKAALAALGLSASQALSWTAHPDWLSTVSRERETRAVVDESLARLVPSALKVKSDILSGDFDLKLKNDVSSEILSHFRIDPLAATRRTMEVPFIEANLLLFVLEELAGNVTGKVVDVTPEDAPDAASPAKALSKSFSSKPKKESPHVSSQTG